MKNYLVFIGEHYYPNGGMEDFIEHFDTIDEAKQCIEDYIECHVNLDKSDFWYHVYSIEDKAIVYKS
jgi:hypothetical protein